MLQPSKLSYLKNELRDKGYNVSEFWDKTNGLSLETYKRFLHYIYSNNDTELQDLASRFGITK